MSVFEKLFSINVNENIQKRNGLSYLPWAWAWARVKQIFPDATYTVYERPDGVIYWTDGRSCWVKTGVTIEGLEHIEYLPIMDFKNRSIPLEQVTSTDVNKAIQRSLTKAAARHGLGLYIYAGEDLPECEQEKAEAPQSTNYDKVRSFMAAREMTAKEFGDHRNAAVAQGIIPDKKVNELSEIEFVALMTFVEARNAGQA